MLAQRTFLIPHSASGGWDISFVTTSGGVLLRNLSSWNNHQVIIDIDGGGYQVANNNPQEVNGTGYHIMRLDQSELQGKLIDVFLEDQQGEFDSFHVTCTTVDTQGEYDRSFPMHNPFLPVAVSVPSASSIASTVWNRSVASHPTGGTFGALGALIGGSSHGHLCVAGGSSSVVRSNATEVDGYWDRMYLAARDSNGDVHFRRIENYQQSNGQFTLDAALPFTPTTNDRLYTIPSLDALVGQQVQGIDLSALSSAVADVDSDVAAVAAQVADVDADVAAVAAQVTDVDSDVAAVAAQVTDVDSDVAAVASAVAGVAAQATDIDGDVAAVAADVTAARSDIAGVAAQVTDVDADVAAVAAQVTDVDGDIGILAGLVSGVGAAVADVDADIVTLSGAVANVDSDVSAVGANVTNARADIAGVAAQSTDIDSDVAALSASVAAVPDAVWAALSTGSLTADSFGQVVKDLLDIFSNRSLVTENPNGTKTIQFFRDDTSTVFLTLTISANGLERTV